MFSLLQTRVERFERERKFKFSPVLFEAFSSSAGGPNLRPA
jgi:hypothetical protein